jgi:hypothetical protein
VIANREIWACALEVIFQHGADAAIHAAMRADQLLEAGDSEGAATWQRILKRINELGEGASATTH